MPLFPFTSQGVEDLLDQLYALPNSKLAEEATAISTNFKAWVATKFSLTTAQLAYLDDMDETATDYYGLQCGFCFENRLQIILNYPEKPQNPSYTKWNTSTNNIMVQADGNGQSNISGEMVFTLTYIS